MARCTLMVALPWNLLPHLRGKFNEVPWPEVFARLPVSAIPATMGFKVPAWDGMVQAFADPRAFGDTSLRGRYGEVRLPILHVTGWYDFLGRDAIAVYTGIQNAAAPNPSRRVQKLIVGPWRHDQIWLKETRIGDEDFGPNSAMGPKKVIELTLGWFDQWLKQSGPDAAGSAPVELFVMGRNEWLKTARWPPPDVEFQTWYFSSRGAANGAAGDGVLSTRRPGKPRSDSFTYDPMNPVPTTGGANSHFFLDNLGVKDQRSVEQRKDVLVYTSAPLKRDTRIVGPLKAVVYASSDGRHSDFTGKLVEVRANGYARIIDDGIRRGPDDLAGNRTATMEPGKVYRFTIALGNTAIHIPKGHRLRVEISSSNFPKYTRNPNTGENPETATALATVRQTVFHGKQYASHVVLPLQR